MDIDVKNLAFRSYIIGFIVVTIFLLYGIQLIQLQLVDQTAKDKSENNVIRSAVRYPARGLLYDRNGKLLVYNKAAYDLMVVPRNIETFDTADLCQTLGIDKLLFDERLAKAKEYSSYRESVLIPQLTSLDFAKLQEKMFRFQGFHVRERTQRAYTSKHAAHTLGYLGEVSGSNINKDDYYASGDNIGKMGIELIYEKELRGEKGRRYYLVDRRGTIKGSYKDGKDDILPIPGKNINLSIDIDLQTYGEQLMANKLGSVIALEPATGEVLALVSSPGYDLTSLVGRIRGENYAELLTDSLKPLYNRALQGMYSPGSTFKMVNGLIGMQENAINKHTRFGCDGPASKPIRCTHYHTTPLPISTAISTSCNPFFWKTFRNTLEMNGRPTREGYLIWYNHVRSFGFGNKLGIDLPYEINGILPHISLYDNLYGKRGWRAITIRSLAIGQGELSVTPLQMANEVSAIANKGYYFAPHIAKSIEGVSLTENYTTRKHTTIDPSHFDEAIEGMSKVYTDSIGTARRYRNRTISMCGKTGTVQNSHGPDHSVFIAFAPKDNPKIAICVIVENSGYGSTYAAPIATLMMEKYIADSIPPHHKYYENLMFTTNLIGYEDPEHTK